MGRLFKLALIGGAAAGAAVVAKKLMGGLGPQPGSPEAPKEWPSLVPEPQAGDNGSAPTDATPAPSEPTAEPTPEPTTEPTKPAEPPSTEPDQAGLTAEEPSSPE